MKANPTPLDGVFIVEPQIFGDNRGWFFESYSQPVLQSLGINMRVVQANRSYSALKGTLRGLHCQKQPLPQAKLVSCTRGAIADYAVDIRHGSPTYLKWFMAELTADNKKMLFVPKGFLHGFVTLTDDVEVEYKVDEIYRRENDRSVLYSDPLFAIDWGVASPVLSDKDREAPLFLQTDIYFEY